MMNDFDADEMLTLTTRQVRNAPHAPHAPLRAAQPLREHDDIDIRNI
jgi:hypothetical protein